MSLASGELAVDPSEDIQYRHDADGKLTSLVDPVGNVYEFGYDDLGRVTTVSGPVTTTFAYGEGKTVRTDPNGNTTRYRFDADGRLTSVTDPLGHTRTCGGDLAATTKASVEYRDSTHPHLPTALTDPAGNTVTYHYDSSGNLTKIHSDGLDADLQTRTYNDDGTLATVIDGNGHQTSYGYDSAGNLTSVTPPEPLGTTHYAYDSLARVVQTSRGNGHRTGFRYDDCDRLVSVTDDDNGTTLLSLRYDPLGNVIHKSGPAWAVNLTWDRNLLTSSERVDDDGTERVGYGYDPCDNLVRLTDVVGTTRFDYDAANRLTALTDPFGQTTRFGHDAAGRRVSVGYPGGAAQAVEYDADGRQTGITVTNASGATVFEVRYGYTNGTLAFAVIDGVTTTFDHDCLNRLTRAGESTFSYDNANNLTDLSGTALTINAANQLVRVNDTILHYDGAGNFTSELNPTGEFLYSSTNQLLGGVFGGRRVVDLSYDGIDNTLPRRVVETALDGTTVTHVFGYTALGLTHVVDNGVRSSYARTPDGGLLAVKAGNGDRYDLIADYQGSVLAVLDPSGDVVGRYTYTPFGAVTASGPAAGHNAFRYRGAYQLLRSAHLMGHRLYNGFWGRFTQSDPTNREHNAYTFAANDPLDAVRTSFWATLTCRPEDIVGAFLSGRP